VLKELKKDIQMAHKQMNKPLISLIIMEMQIKTIVICIHQNAYHQKRQKITNAGEDAEKGGTLMLYWETVENSMRIP
jgi:hypothetical protein